MAKITFLPNHEINVRYGAEFLQIDHPFKFGCRKGCCGVCALNIQEGRQNLSKQSIEEVETLKRKGLDSEKYRLACQCAINGDIKILCDNITEE